MHVNLYVILHYGDLLSQFRWVNTPLGFLKECWAQKTEKYANIDTTEDKDALFPFVLHYILCDGVYYKQQESETCTFIIKYKGKKYASNMQRSQSGEATLCRSITAEMYSNSVVWIKAIWQPI